MKGVAAVKQMLERIERSLEPGESESRGALIMAFEWVLDSSISTSQGLEDWLDEKGTA